jgi:hypothetical protein
MHKHNSKTMSNQGGSKTMDKRSEKNINTKAMLGDSTQCYAAGGVAKMRLGQDSTKKSSSNKGC